MKPRILLGLMGLWLGFWALEGASPAHARGQNEPREIRKNLSLGLLLYNIGAYEKAKPYLVKVWELDPQNGRIAYYLGRTHNELKDYWEATRWFKLWYGLGIAQWSKIENTRNTPYHVPLSTPQHLREVHGDSLEGEFTVGVLIGKGGLTREVEALYGSEVFRKVAVGAAKRFRLQSVKHEGDSRETWVVVRVTFSKAGGYEVEDAQSVDKEPELMVPVIPEYPDTARDAGITGVVAYRMQIGKDGKVKQVEIVEGPEVFHETVRAAALQCEFSPAIYKGKPVTIWIKRADVFTLE